MPRTRTRGNIDFFRLRTLRGNLRVGVGNADMWNEISTMTPLGYRASFLAYFKFPSSFASYMFGVSPALMSQNNYKEDIQRGMSRQNGYAPLSSEEMEKAWKALALMYYDNTDNPNRDVPSRIRRQEGVSQSTINGFKEFVYRLALTASDTGPSQVADAPLAETMPVEGVSVSVDGDGNVTSADEEVIAEMSAGMDGEEEEVVQEATSMNTGSNVQRRNPTEGIYNLYGSYFRRVHEVNETTYLEEMQTGYSNVRRSARCILILEKLGFGTIDIRAMLDTFANRSLSIYGLEAGVKRGYGAYIKVNLKGVRSSASAYQSRISKEIMATMGGVAPSRVDRQFAPSTGRALQTFRFSGMGRGTVVGLQVLSLNDINSVPNEDSRSEGNNKLRLKRIEAEQELASQGTSNDTQTTALPPTGSGIKLYLIGYQQFMPRQTYRQSRTLRTQGGLLGESLSYVFYFATLDRDERISGWYRSVFGEARLDVSGFDITFSSLTSLKNAWNDSGNLDELGVLKVSPVPQSDVDNLRQALQQVVALGLNTFISQIQFKPTRGQGAGASNVPFTDINRRSNMVLSALRNAFEGMEIVQNNAASLSSEQGLTTQQLKSVKQQSFERGFGVEIEGNFDETNKNSVARLLTQKGFPTESTGYHGQAPRGYFKLESDSSVQNDLRTGGGTFEMVSPVLQGEAGITKLSGVLQVIRSQGARTSPSAGTHIHFGYADFGIGESGFEKRKRLIVNFCVLQPFFEATQILQARNRGYAQRLKLTSAKIKKLADSPDYTTLRSRWSDVGGGRGALHLKEGYNMTAGSVPTYEFRFPASNFETDTITNMVRLIEKVWSASIIGYLPHSVESSKPKEAEEWLEDLLGQELFSFWKNRYRDLQGVEDYKVDSATPRRSDVTNASGETIVSNRYLPTLNSW